MDADRLVLIVAVAAIVSIIAISLSVNNSLLGRAAKSFPGPNLEINIILDDGFIAPDGAVTVDSNTVIAVDLQTNVGRSVDRIDVAALNTATGCMDYLGSVSQAPYHLDWVAADTVGECGYGRYQVRASAVHPSGSEVTAISFLTLTQQ